MDFHIVTHISTKKSLNFVGDTPSCIYFFIRLTTHNLGKYVVESTNERYYTYKTII